MILRLTLLLGSFAAQAQSDTSEERSVYQIRGVTVTGAAARAEAALDRPEALSMVEIGLGTRAMGAIVADLLRDVPGVQVQQTSAGQGAVIIRGLIGNQVLLLVDGIPLNNSTYRDGPGQYLATIDPEAIEHIEIVRGPGSMLYGSDAQGGAVNIITRSHAFAGSRSVRVSGRYSTANRGGRTRLSAGAQGRRWSLAMGGSLGFAGDLRAGGGLGRQHPTAFDTRAVDAELTVRPRSDHTVTAVVQHFEMADVPRYDRYVDFRKTEGWGPDAEHVFDPQTRRLAYARYAYAPRDAVLHHFEATVSLAFQREGRHQIRLTDGGVPDDVRTLWRDDVYTPGVSLVGQSRMTVADRLVRLQWGADFYRDYLASEGWTQETQTGLTTPLVRQSDGGLVATGNFPDGAQASRVGAFLSAETEVFRRLRIATGVRWSRFDNEADVGIDFGGRVDNSSTDVTAQVGVIAAPTRRWRVAVRLAEGFRAPNLYDLTRVGPVPGGIALPNPDAKPERSLSAEVSVRWSARPTAVSITLYRTTIDDFIDRAPSAFRGDTLFNGERVFQGVNVGSATVRGVEAAAAQRVGPLDVQATLLVTHGDQRLADGAVEPMSKIPPVNGSGSVRWANESGEVWAEYVLRWAVAQRRLGSRDLSDPRIPDGGTPGFAVHGVRAGAMLQYGLTLSAGLENLTDELYRDHASGVDNAGRHLWVGVSWAARM